MFRRLEIDALSGVNTSMFGAVMSEVYNEAMTHYGQLNPCLDLKLVH